MRYHWGLAVGHLYTHGGQDLPGAPQAQSPDEGIDILEGGGTNESESEIQTNEAPVENRCGDEGDAEFSLESRDAEDLLNASEEEEELDLEDEEHIFAMEEMYNS
jgi:hypothetical protein